MHQHKVLSNLTPYQEDILLSKAKVKIMLCGRQVGKSQMLRILTYKYALDNPNTEILVIAKTQKSVREILWRNLVESVDALFIPEVIKNTNSSRMTIELINGSRITFSSSEAIDSVRGMTVDLVVLEEFQSHLKPDYVWSVVQPMLNMKNGDAVIAGTANGFDALWEMAEKGNKDSPEYTPGFRTWKIPTPDCGLPSGSPEAIRFAKSTMSPAQFNQEYLILPTALTGRICPDYDMDLNESTISLDPKKPLLISMDFNVAFMIATINQIEVYEEHHPNGRLKYREERIHCIDEFTQTNTTTDKFARALFAKYSDWKGNLIVYPDASGSARKTSSDTNDHAILRDNGFRIQTNRANPAHEMRINSFNRMVLDALGRRKYFVNKRCKNVIKSLIGLTYNSEGKIDKKSGYDHAYDAASYLIAYLYPIKTKGITQHSLNPD